jgi:two-component system heavy metal sensor histidine kinase CusS
MRWTADPRRWLRRSEVRLGLTLAGAIALLMAALLYVLFLVSTHEAAEVLEATLEREVERAAADLARGHEPTQANPEISVRLRRADGSSRLLFGRWSESGRVLPEGSSSLRLALASRRDYLSERDALPGGASLEARIRLTGFVEERREQLVQLAVSFGVGLLGAVAVAVFATRAALAPLRSTTRALEQIDERHLSERIASRGTGDLLDRHAEGLNRVLARLEASFARMAAFGADVAHELRTPVNRILNQADVALLRGDRDAATRALGAVREGAEEMRRLIEDMLLLARGDEGGLAPRPERLAVGAVVGDLVELYRPTCEERDVTLALAAPACAPEVATDRQLLQRAVSNLLDNAVRHTPAGGHIEVELRQEAGRTRISVSDSGEGVPEPERERIFDRFVQLDPARSAGGAGLGLPIARMIARLLGGDLGVASSALGGARFELVLPDPGTPLSPS